MRTGEACRAWPLPIPEVELRDSHHSDRALFLASRLYPFREPSSDLWLVAKAGLIGAAFSIALAIRDRTVALDTELVANVASFLPGFCCCYSPPALSRASGSEMPISSLAL